VSVSPWLFTSAIDHRWQNSLGNMSPEENAGFSKIFFDFFKRMLGAPDDRGYMYMLSILYLSSVDRLTSPERTRIHFP
jgi:hypothetical protein